MAKYLRTRYPDLQSYIWQFTVPPWTAQIFSDSFNADVLVPITFVPLVKLWAGSLTSYIHLQNTLDSIRTLVSKILCHDDIQPFKISQRKTSQISQL